MLNNKDYCDYETCVALKELGFKDSTEYYYANNGEYTTTHDNWHSEYTQCWSLYEAQKWLREEKEIFVYIDVPWKTDDGLGWSYFCCNKPMTEEDKEVCFASGGFYDSYEEALLEGVRASIKILQDEQKENN